MVDYLKSVVKEHQWLKQSLILNLTISLSWKTFYDAHWFSSMHKKSVKFQVEWNRSTFSIIMTH
jgi:hypothetical protein